MRPYLRDAMDGGIDEGDSIAVVVATTALGIVPLIIPMHDRNERPLPQAPPRSHRRTIPAPAPAAMEPRNPAFHSNLPGPPTTRRTPQWRATLRPETKST